MTRKGVTLSVAGVGSEERFGNKGGSTERRGAGFPAGQHLMSP